MEKWRKKLGLAVLSAGLFTLSAGSASADSCNPCPPCDPCGSPCGWDFCNMQLELGVDYLYWKPCVDDLNYAAVQTSTENSVGGTDVVNTNYKSICPDWESGVRAYVKLKDFLYDWDVYGSYTYINPSDKGHTLFTGTLAENSGIVSTLLNPQGIKLGSGEDLGYYTQAGAKWSMEYNEWDVLFGYDINCNSCHTFTPYFGVAGIVLDQKLCAGYKNVPSADTTYNDTVHWKADYWGVGLRVGTDYKYRFNDCLGFFAKANGTLLAGKVDKGANHQTFSSSTPAGTASPSHLNFKDDDCCHFVPGFHIALGFSYDTCFCDNEFSVKLGYEFLEWYNLPSPRVFATGESAYSSNSTSPYGRTIGMHGLLAGLAFSF